MTSLSVSGTSDEKKSAIGKTDIRTNGQSLVHMWANWKESGQKRRLVQGMSSGEWKVKAYVVYPWKIFQNVRHRGTYILGSATC